MFFQTLVDLLRDDDGASAIEYALLAGLIAIVFVAGATLLGGSLQGIFQAVANCVQSSQNCNVPIGNAGA